MAAQRLVSIVGGDFLRVFHSEVFRRRVRQSIREGLKSEKDRFFCAERTMYDRPRYLFSEARDDAHFWDWGRNTPANTYRFLSFRFDYSDERSVSSGDLIDCEVVPEQEGACLHPDVRPVAVTAVLKGHDIEAIALQKPSEKSILFEDDGETPKDLRECEGAVEGINRANLAEEIDVMKYARMIRDATGFNTSYLIGRKTRRGLEWDEIGDVECFSYIPVVEMGK